MNDLTCSIEQLNLSLNILLFKLQIIATKSLNEQVIRIERKNDHFFRTSDLLDSKKKHI